MAEGWTKDWERRIVNGVYPLRRFLGQSDHSVVFLTDYKAQNIVRAAIKILPDNPALSEAQLGYWRTAAALSHPHLMRLLDSGRCQLGGHDFLFVVMDYAEQNLGQILPSRPLTPHELKELLLPTLDALAFLHVQNLVQGGLKPSNFLVVHDQLKLASDTIRPAGVSPAGAPGGSLYDPPESKNGTTSTAGDLWGLGITLVEALTQTTPAWARESSEDVSLPPSIAPEFADTIRRCLRRDPGQRPAVAELLSQLTQPPPVVPVQPVSVIAVQPPTVLPTQPPPVIPMTAVAPVAPVAPPVAPVGNELSIRTLVARLPPKMKVFAIPGGGVIALAAVWAGVHFTGARTPDHSSAPPTLQSPPAVAPPPPVGGPKANAPALLPTVVHQEIPDISRSARESIRGVIQIAVRVDVDRSGNVVAATLDHHVSSRYFDRAATDAAAKWKFAPAADSATRGWLLHFEFTRAGVRAHAAALR